MDNMEREAIKKRIEILEEKIFYEQMKDFANNDWIHEKKQEIKELKKRLEND